MVVGNAGNALFANLALIFAIGVAYGFARKSDGSTALAGLVGYLVFAEVLCSSSFARRPGRRAAGPVGMCGEAASDPLLALVLVGLGVTSLSMAPVRASTH